MSGATSAEGHNANFGNQDPGEGSRSQLAQSNMAAVQAAQAQRQAILARALQVGYQSDSSNLPISPNHQRSYQAPNQSNTPQRIVHPGPPNLQAWSSELPPARRSDIPFHMLNQNQGQAQAQTAFARPQPHQEAPIMYFNGVALPRSLENASDAMKAKVVETLRVAAQQNNARDAPGQQYSNQMVQPNVSNRQTGPIRSQHQALSSPVTATASSSRHATGVHIPPPTSPSIHIANSDDSSQIFRKLLPENFQARPRFVPSHVVHFSKEYNEKGKVPISPARNYAHILGADKNFENLKLNVDKTPPHEILRPAGAGIGRLVGLLPATDLLDREANTFQTALVSMVKMLEAANSRASNAEFKLSEQDKEIKSLKEDVSSMKKQLNAISLGLGATKSDSAIPFGKALENIHQYIIEASKRDKWLSGKIFEYDRKLGLLDQTSEVQSERAESRHLPTLASDQVNSMDKVTTSMETTGQAAQALGRELAHVVQAQVETLSVEGVNRQTSGSPGGEKSATEGATRKQTLFDCWQAKSSINGGLLDKTVRSMERDVEESSEGRRIESNREDNEEATVEAEEEEGNEDHAGERNGDGMEGVEEGEASPETETPPVIKGEDERDELEPEDTAAATTATAVVTTEEASAPSRSPAQDDSAEAAPKVTIQTRSSTSPSGKSLAFDQRASKRRRTPLTSFFVHKGHQIESIVISSDAETDEEDEYNDEEETRNGKRYPQRAKH